MSIISSLHFLRSIKQIDRHRGQGEEGGGQREGEQERPGPADQPHQERGEGSDLVPAGHGLQEGAARDKDPGIVSQIGKCSTGASKFC